MRTSLRTRTGDVYSADAPPRREGAELTAAVLDERFEIGEPIGSGGMGTVYAATDRASGERVAVKVLTGSSEMTDRFLREARVLSSLRHPAIVRYLAHGDGPEGLGIGTAGVEQGRPLADEGDDLGSVEELMIDLHTGRVSYAVISFGGFLGMGDKLFAIPWDMLSVDTDEEHFVMDIDKETLENAPGFDKDNWPQVVSRNWLAEVYTYYDIQPYW